MTTQSEFSRDEVLFHQGSVAEYGAADCCRRSRSLARGGAEPLSYLVMRGPVSGLVKWRRSKPAVTAPQHVP